MTTSHSPTAIGHLSAQQVATLTQLAQRYGATRLLLFGSALDPTRTPHDVDLACDGVDGWALFELGVRLENALDQPLDLIPLNPPSQLTEAIERQAVVLL